MCPCGNESSGSRSNVVDGWMAGVTAPVAGSTCTPAWTATVSILMVSVFSVAGAEHDTVLRPPRQRHTRLTRQRDGLRVRYVDPERSALHAHLQPHDRAEKRDDVHHAVEPVDAVGGGGVTEHAQLLGTHGQCHGRPVDDAFARRAQALAV